MISKRIDRGKKTSDFDRLGRYVLEAKTDAAAILWTRTAEYVVDLKDDSSGEKVLWYRLTNCQADVPAMAIAEVLATQAENSRSQADKTYHCVVSFPEGEVPTRAQLEDIEDALCQALGFQAHQRISAVHQDTDNIHLHLAISKVHPVTFNVHEPYRDYYIRDKVCRAMEQKHGLSLDNGMNQGQRQGKAADMEALSGRQSLVGWIESNAKGDLLEAVGKAHQWEAVHAAMADYGLVIKPRGAGLVIALQDGSQAVKASAVDKMLSFGALTQRLGAYQPPQAATEKVERVDARKQYSAMPKQPDAEAAQLYAAFQANRQDALTARQALRAQQRQERLAYGDTLKQWHQGERLKIKVSFGRGGQKRAAYQRLSQDRKHAWASYQQKAADEKKSLQTQQPLLTWEQYLIQSAEAGNTKALELLRNKKLRQEKAAEAVLSADRLDTARSVVYADLKPLIQRNGHILYRVQDGGQVTDEQNRVRVDTQTVGSVFLALTLASERFIGQGLTVSGSEAFKHQVVHLAVRYGLEIQFKDAGLEQERQRQLQAKVDSQAIAALPAPLQAYLDARNQLRAKVKDLLNHRVWQPQDATGEGIYQGRRTLSDGSSVMLIEKSAEILVKPLNSEQVASGLKVGTRLQLEGWSHQAQPGKGVKREGWQR